MKSSTHDDYEKHIQNILMGIFVNPCCTKGCNNVIPKRQIIDHKY